MSMNLYDKDGKLYSKTVSTHYENYQASGEAWVFSEPTICVPDDYTIEYVLKDYEYNGTYSNKFTIKTPLNPDTTIYIVVPVKRCVTITIKDANLDLVNGVFGNIISMVRMGIYCLQLIMMMLLTLLCVQTLPERLGII